jgi:hypothetical protein
MTTKSINKILGGIFFADYAYGLYLTATILMVWTPITDYYTGTTLLLFTGKILLNFALGLAVVIALFLNNKKAILISVPLYVAQIFISKYWAINPNSPKFTKMIEEAQNAMNSGGVIFSDVKATVYPFSFIYLLYIVSIIYIFAIMPKLMGREIKTESAQQAN